MSSTATPPDQGADESDGIDGSDLAADWEPIPESWATHGGRELLRRHATRYWAVAVREVDGGSQYAVAYVSTDGRRTLRRYRRDEVHNVPVPVSAVGATAWPASIVETALVVDAASEAEMAVLDARYGDEIAQMQAANPAR